eukprot:6421302-Amphidinium_carterae.1
MHLRSIKCSTEVCSRGACPEEHSRLLCRRLRAMYGYSHFDSSLMGKNQTTTAYGSSSTLSQNNAVYPADYLDSKSLRAL